MVQRHCEAYEIGRGNLKYFDIMFSNKPLRRHIMARLSEVARKKSKGKTQYQSTKSYKDFLLDKAYKRAKI